MYVNPSNILTLHSLRLLTTYVVYMASFHLAFLLASLSVIRPYSCKKYLPDSSPWFLGHRLRLFLTTVLNISFADRFFWGYIFFFSCCCSCAVVFSCARVLNCCCYPLAASLCLTALAAAKKISNRIHCNRCSSALGVILNYQPRTPPHEF